jgi:hypothetical protein
MRDAGGSGLRRRHLYDPQPLLHLSVRRRRRSSASRRTARRRPKLDAQEKLDPRLRSHPTASSRRTPRSDHRSRHVLAPHRRLRRKGGTRNGRGCRQASHRNSAASAAPCGRSAREPQPCSPPPDRDPRCAHGNSRSEADALGCIVTRGWAPPHDFDHLSASGIEHEHGRVRRLVVHSGLVDSVQPRSVCGQCVHQSGELHGRAG